MLCYASGIFAPTRLLLPIVRMSHFHSAKKFCLVDFQWWNQLKNVIKSVIFFKMGLEVKTGSQSNWLRFGTEEKKDLESWLRASSYEGGGASLDILNQYCPHFNLTKCLKSS